MCWKYRLKDAHRVLELADKWAVDGDGTTWEEVDVTTGHARNQMPVVYASESGALLGGMRWGVWPWYEKAMPRSLIVNARDDKLLTGRLWKKPAAHRRCLIPADGFLEWAGPVGSKWEVLFHLEDNEPFFFAGLWDNDPDGTGRGCTIITTRPNEMIAALPHDRMPVILDNDGARAWLGSEPLPDDRLQALCAPYPAGEMRRVDLPRPEPRTKTKKIGKTELNAPGELDLQG